MNLFKKARAEFIGTFFLVFVGCGSIQWVKTLDLDSSYFIPDFSFGFIIMVMIAFFAPISGAHFNPAVSLAFFMKRKLSGKEFFTFSFSQMFAGILACTLLFLIQPHSSVYGATTPHIGLFPSLFIEIGLTFILISVIFLFSFYFTWRPLFTGFIVGLTVSFCSIIGGPLTGASMNPARTLGPNLFEGVLSELWLYFLGPVVGALLATLVVSYFQEKERIYEKSPFSLCR